MIISRRSNPSFNSSVYKTIESNVCYLKNNMWVSPMSLTINALPNKSVLNLNSSDFDDYESSITEITESSGM